MEASFKCSTATGRFQVQHCCTPAFKLYEITILLPGQSVSEQDNLGRRTILQGLVKGPAARPRHGNFVVQRAYLHPAPISAGT